MPLIIVTGRPCVGKTTFSRKLKEMLESREDIGSVVLVSEETENVERKQGYASAASEKVTRGVLKGAIDHALSDKAYVIADSLNYIKGYRYELYCMARTSKTRHCCVYVHCEDIVSEKWSRTREELTGEGYDEKILADLRRRYEMPNERNRWDCPMFRVDMTPIEEKKAATPTASVAAASSKGAGVGEAPARISSFRRKTSSGSSVAASTVSTVKKVGDSTGARASASDPLVFNRLDERGSAGGGGTSSGDAECDGTESSPESVLRGIVDYFDRAAGEPSVTPNSSTVKAASGAADLLDELEVVCADIVSSIQTHQLSEGGLGIPLLLKRYDRSLNLPRIVSPAELARSQAQFIKMQRSKPPSDSIAGGTSFVDFVANQLDN